MIRLVRATAARRFPSESGGVARQNHSVSCRAALQGTVVNFGLVCCCAAIGPKRRSRDVCYSAAVTTRARKDAIDARQTRAKAFGSPLLAQQLTLAHLAPDKPCRIGHPSSRTSPAKR